MLVDNKYYNWFKNKFFAGSKKAHLHLYIFAAGLRPANNTMLTIRNATTNDIPLIRELNLQVWPQTYTPILGEEQVAYMLAKFYTPGSLLEQMGPLGHQFIICSYNNEPVAFASFARADDDTFKLNKIYIIPGYQGRGVGKFIVDHIAGAVRAMGAQWLVLNVNIYNRPAIAFYEKTGFIKFREEDIDIGNGYFMNDYVLRLSVG